MNGTTTTAWLSSMLLNIYARFSASYGELIANINSNYQLNDDVHDTSTFHFLIAQLGKVIILFVIEMYGMIMKTAMFHDGDTNDDGYGGSSSSLNASKDATCSVGITCSSSRMSAISINPMMNFSVGMMFLLLSMWFVLFPVVSCAFKFRFSLPSSSATNINTPKNARSTQRARDHYFFDPNERSLQSNRQHGDNTNNTFTSLSRSSMNKSSTMEDENFVLSPRPFNSFKNVLNEVSSMFEERSAQVKKALEDFSQPFVGSTRSDGEEDDDNVTMTSTGSEDHLETIVVEGILPDNCDNTSTAANAHSDGSTMMRNEIEQITHFCFLVHGYRGKPADLLYLRSAMAETAEKSFNTVSSPSSSPTNSSHEQERDENDEIEELDTSMQRKQQQEKKHRIVLHSCQSNWNKTSDGVEAGGERIFNEILNVIRTAMQNHTTINSSTNTENDNDGIVDVTMSLIGNSLGGLYSRYAIAKLAEFAEEQYYALNHNCTINNDRNTHQNSNTTNNNETNSKRFFLIDGKIRIHFNIFCTTATPHLGVSGQTYFALPRTAEVAIGSLMGQTGRDIFRMSPLIKKMCTTDLYLKPLGSFRKRIAYANGYHTDFVVSTQTAAFLHPESTIPHRMAEERDLVEERKDDVNSENSNETGMVAATLYTQASGDVSAAAPISVVSSGTGNKSESVPNKESFRDRIPNLLKIESVKEELLEMSSALDQLGWKKVIVDLRNEMPVKLPVPPRPRNILPRIVKKWSGDTTDSREEEETLVQNGNELEFGDMVSSSNDVNPSQSKILESRDVANTYSIPDDFIGFPLGHNTMVAVAQSRLTFVFKGGRPLMDKLAIEMIDEILNYQIVI